MAPRSVQTHGQRAGGAAHHRRGRTVIKLVPDDEYECFTVSLGQTQQGGLELGIYASVGLPLGRPCGLRMKALAQGHASGVASLLCRCDTTCDAEQPWQCIAFALLATTPGNQEGVGDNVLNGVRRDTARRKTPNPLVARAEDLLEVFLVDAHIG